MANEDSPLKVLPGVLRGLLTTSARHTSFVSPGRIQSPPDRSPGVSTQHPSVGSSIPVKSHDAEPPGGHAHAEPDDPRPRSRQVKRHARLVGSPIYGRRRRSMTHSSPEYSILSGLGPGTAWGPAKSLGGGSGGRFGMLLGDGRLRLSQETFRNRRIPGAKARLGAY